MEGCSLISVTKLINRKLVKYFTLIVALLMVAVSLSACVSDGSAASELPRLKNSKLSKEIKEACANYQKKGTYTGMSVAVIVDGEVAYFNFGTMEQGGKPVNENTLYEIASITKVFTGTLLADAVLSGKVNLDDPVQNYFDSRVPHYRGEQMTLVQLASHSSGLPRMPYNFKSTSNPYNDYKEEDLLEYLEKGVLVRAPGTGYEYSNLGLGLLGYTLSKVDGRSYEQLLREVILDKLEMSSTAVYLNDEQQQRKATPHLMNGKPTQEWDFDVLQPCGGLKSTARDLAHWAAACMGSLEIDEQLTQAIKLATKTHYWGPDARVGLGWHVSDYGGMTCIQHDGLVGGYCSFIAIAPEQKLGVVVLNNNGGTVIPLGRELIMLLDSYQD